MPHILYEQYDYWHSTADSNVISRHQTSLNTSIYPDSVPAFHIASLLNSLNLQGVDCENVLARFHLSIRALSTREARIPRVVMAKLLAALSSATGRTDLGFELGMQADLLQLPLVGRMLAAIESPADAIRLISTCMPLLTPSFSMSYYEESGRLVVEWTPKQAMPYEVLTLALEAILVIAWKTCTQRFSNQDACVQAYVSWARPLHAARYNELTGLTVEFASMQLPPRVHLQMTFASGPRRWASASNCSDEAGYTTNECEAQLASVYSLRSWSGWVRHVLQSSEVALPTQEDLAALMGVTSRTLARHLTEDHTTYRAIAQAVLHERALDMLEHTALTVQEIGERLGYSDTANFSRAFKRLAGVSPAVWRHSSSQLKSHEPAPELWCPYSPGN